MEQKMEKKVIHWRMLEPFEEILQLHSVALRMTGRGHSYNNSLCLRAKLHFAYEQNFTAKATSLC